MIQVNFSGYNDYVTDSLHQWDLNQELTIHGLGVAVAPVIVFANRNISKGIVVQSKLENGVITCAIPNALLQFACDITAHLCDENYKEYKAYECIKIPVIARVEPADYLYTDNVPILTYESVIGEMGQIKASVERDMLTIKSEVQNIHNVDIAKVGEDIDKVEKEIATERARIDQFTKLSEGSTTGDAELMDIRVDAKGNTHESAGTAVREQILELDSKIDANVSELSSEIVENRKDLSLLNPILDIEFVNKSYVKPSFVENTKRLSNEMPILAEYDLPVVAYNGYRFAVNTWADTDISKGNISDSGWQTEYTISKGTYYTLVICRPNANEDITPTEKTNIHIEYLGKVIGDMEKELNNISEMNLSKNINDFFNGDIYECKYAWDSVENEKSARPLLYNVPISIEYNGDYIFDRMAYVSPKGYLHFNIDLSFENAQFFLWYKVKKNDGTYELNTYKELASGNNDVLIDLNWFAVYKDATEITFFFSFNSKTLSKCDILLKEPMMITEYGQYSTYGSTLGKWLSNIDTKISGDNAEKDSVSFVVSPNGTKYAQQIDDNGNTVNIPVIPSKVVFIGNSLLAGFNTFGMCASDNENDYAYLFKSYVDSLGNDTNIVKIPSADWESITSLSGKENWVNANITSDKLSGANLVVIQLGDNVNTDEKISVFKEGASYLVSYIRQNVPNARVCWVGSWYSQANMEIVKEVCRNKGCLFVDIRSLNVVENRAKIGDIVDRGQSYSLSYNINNYTDDTTNKKLTVIFTVDGTEYTSIVPYESYSFSNGTITINGQYQIVSNNGIASHPGNKGFKAITNTMLYDLGIADSKDTF